eukprot:5763044-Karenia_brevis.AAC.1
MIRRAWVRSLYLQESRTDDRGSRDIIPGLQPVLDAHRENKSIIGFDKWKPTNLAAIGTSRDGHFVAAQLLDQGYIKEEAEKLAICKCGAPLPSRQHLAWACPVVAQKRRDLQIAEPTCNAEQRLLITCSPV